MPAPEQEILLTARQTTLNIRLEPAHNVFHSLLLLAKPDKASEFSDWITETLQSMSAKERLRHQVVMIGLFFAVKPAQSWSSFPKYIDHLDQLSPFALRDKLLYAYVDLPCLADGRDNVSSDSTFIVEDVLETVDAFLNFLEERFPPDHIDRSLESKAYAYIIDPPALKSLVINHLRSIWEKYMEAEWMRVKPMLQDAVAAFEQVDYTTMDRLQAAEFITGQSITDRHFIKKIEQAEQVVFVPSVHVGPYLGGFNNGRAYGVIFGARLPEGTRYYAPDLSRAEILVRLGALSDDNRLQILRFIAEEGEKRSQEIIDQFNLSQSAASRHLKQLSATGYLLERRCDGAKCYQLNSDRIEDTLRAVLSYLSISS